MRVRSLGQEDPPGGGNGNSLQYSCRKSQGQKSLAGYRPWGRKETRLRNLTHTGTHIYPSIKRLPHVSDWTIKSEVSFLPVSAFSSRTPLNQPKQFISLVRCKYWCLFFCYLSRNTSVEIHCNIRSSKGVLSYTAAINEHEECKDFEFNFFGGKKFSLTFLSSTVYLKIADFCLLCIDDKSMIAPPSVVNLELFYMTCPPFESLFSWFGWLLDQISMVLLPWFKEA